MCWDYFDKSTPIPRRRFSLDIIGTCHFWHQTNAFREGWTQGSAKVHFPLTPSLGKKEKKLVILHLIYQEKMKHKKLHTFLPNILGNRSRWLANNRTASRTSRIFFIFLKIGIVSLYSFGNYTIFRIQIKKCSRKDHICHY